jgi:hypothetical protein
MVIAWWDHLSEAWRLMWADDRGISWEPTHWMALPEPPVADGADVGTENATREVA